MEERIKITTEYIKLDQFLKWAGVAKTGSEAKMIISDEDVLVNGEVEKRRGRKLRKGDSVQVMERTFIID